MNDHLWFFLWGFVVGSCVASLGMLWLGTHLAKKEESQKDVSCAGAAPYQSNESWGGSYMKDED